MWREWSHGQIAVVSSIVSVACLHRGPLQMSLIRAVAEAVFSSHPLFQHLGSQQDSQLFSLDFRAYIKRSRLGLIYDKPGWAEWSFKNWPVNEPALV